MKRLLTGLTATVLLSACAQFTLVETKRQTVGELSVSPQIQWSRIKLGNVELWTVNGPSLDAVRFFDKISDGDSLFTVVGQRKESMPKFRQSMRETEVQEFVIDTLAAMGMASVEASDLRPQQFGSERGFRFQLSFITEDGLETDGMAAGIMRDGALYFVLFTGARLHYFPTYRDPVDRLIASLRLEA